MTPPPWVLVTGGFHDRTGQDRPFNALATHLADAGAPVHLVAWTDAPGWAGRPGVTLHRVRRVPGADVIGNLFLARAGRAVARRVTRADPAARVVVAGANCVWADVNWVHYLHHASVPNLAGAPAWFRAKEAAVGRLYRRQERRAVRAARLVVVNSGRTRDDVVRCLGVPADRVRVVYYGADPKLSPPTADERKAARSLFDLPPGRPAVVFVGGFGYDNRKGFDTLLTAWEELCRDPGWDADLLMAGGGRAAAAVSARVKSAGLDGRVRLLGYTDRVPDLLAAADLLVSPVRYEPYGLNVQEALCRGVPAVVSAVAGVAERYPSELAGLVLPDPDDAADLARRLRVWRRDAAGWRDRVRPLSDALRGRSWADMAREVVEVVRATSPGGG